VSYCSASYQEPKSRPDVDCLHRSLADERPPFRGFHLGLTSTVNSFLGSPKKPFQDRSPRLAKHCALKLSDKSVIEKLGKKVSKNEKKIRARFFERIFQKNFVTFFEMNFYKSAKFFVLHSFLP
jgi:hypothetical protein